MNELVSIIMTVKNGATHLKECVDSITNQSYKNWELLVVDNNSSDNTLAILKSFIDDRIIVVENRLNSKIPEALNLITSKISGKYVTRMDADDIMHPKKIELLLSQIDHTKSIAVGLVKYFPDELVKDGYRKYEHWLNNTLLNNNPYNQIYKECIIPAPSWLMHKSTFDEIGGIQNIIPEDYDFAFRCYKNRINIRPTNEVVHFWREHVERNSRHDPDYEDNNFFEMKIDYFLKCEYEKNIPVVVWGAGKKGKSIIKLLQSTEIPVIWLTDNDSKIGHNIYGIILKKSTILNELKRCNVIVAVSSPDDIEYINDIKNNNHNEQIQFFNFC